MKLPTRLFGPALLIAFAWSAACRGSSTPAAPTPTPAPTPPPVTAALAAPEPVSPVGTQQLDTLKPTLQVRNAAATGTVGTVTYRFEWSELDSFPADSRTGSADSVAQDAGGTTSFEIPATLKANFILFWRARATNGTLTSNWSRLESFKTQNKGFRVGQTIYDPLTDGTTVGQQRGGRFVSGGWQVSSITDGIDYDIPTCTSCRVEFDVTNFGRKEGEPYQKDLKWFSMGDASTFGNFGAFRDHPWKMHLEQRADNDNGLKLIWRNGAAGDNNPGDHTNKTNVDWTWRGSDVYHFVFEWDPRGFRIWVNGVQVFEDGFGGNPFAPGNHRISLGCWARGETLSPGAIYSNFSVAPR